MNYMSTITKIVTNNSKYMLNGQRNCSGYLKSNFADIFEKLPENTPTNVYQKLIELSQNPRTTIYKAAEELQKLNLDVNTKAKNLLGDLYEKVAQKARMQGNTRRAEIFEKSAQNTGSLEKDTTYLQLLDALYNDLRLFEYDIKYLRNSNIDQITKKGNALIRVKDQNGWHYRLPKNSNNIDVIDRVSINAVADENLIKELDTLIGNGSVKGYYKTPDLSANWLERHDPVTIYLGEKATPEVLKKIHSTCAKYVRSTEDVLLGENFAPGFAKQKSPEVQDIELLLSKMKKVDSNMESCIRKFFTDAKTGQLKTSAGYFEAAQKMLEKLS